MVYNPDMTQPALLELDTKDINPYWIDVNQPLKIPTNPLHYEAHKLQLISERLEKQAERNPAQFNSGNYLAILDKLAKLWKAINDGKTEISDEGNVATNGNGSPEIPVGSTVALSVDNGVSPDNPAAG